jgi:hypothetical protein
MSKGPPAPRALPVRQDLLDPSVRRELLAQLVQQDPLGRLDQLDQLDPPEQKEQRVLREPLDLQDQRVLRARQDLLDPSARRELLALLARQDPLGRLDPPEQKEQRVLRGPLGLQDQRVLRARQDLLDPSARRELLAPLARQDPLVLAARLVPQVWRQCRHSAAWFWLADPVRSLLTATISAG